MDAAKSIAARIVNAEGALVDARVFRDLRPLSALDPDAAVKGLNEAFAKIATELVVWTCGLI